MCEQTNHLKMIFLRQEPSELKRNLYLTLSWFHDLKFHVSKIHSWDETICVCMYVYIYIYIERERERLEESMAHSCTILLSACLKSVAGPTKAFIMINKITIVTSNKDCLFWHKDLIYIYIYICHPRTDYFIVSQLFSVARYIGHLKLGLKSAQLYITFTDLVRYCSASRQTMSAREL